MLFRSHCQNNHLIFLTNSHSLKFKLLARNQWYWGSIITKNWK